MTHFLLIGLGNPGPHYSTTRHNLGIIVLRAWIETAAAAAWCVHYNPWRVDKDMAELAELVLRDEADHEVQVTAYFPGVPMNSLGRSVAAYIDGDNFTPEELLILHDDIELPFGEVRSKRAGSAAGHNGVRSIHQALGSNVSPRVRIGIGRPADDQAISDFVLSNFTPAEQAQLPEVVASAGEHVTNYIRRAALV